MVVAERRPEIFTPEEARVLTSYDFFLLHGLGSILRIPKWEKDLKRFLVRSGVEEDQIKTPHLRHPVAKYSSWLKDSGLPADPQESAKAVIVGHSSGAEMALRYSEEYAVAGLVLFAPYDTPDCGSGLTRPITRFIERSSRMFDREFDWQKIVKNCGFVIVVHATGDNLVRGNLSVTVFEKLQEASLELSSQNGTKPTEVVYLSVEGRGHIPSREQFPEVISKMSEVIIKSNPSAITT